MRNNIKALREARGWSMAKLGEAAECDAATIDKLEKGKMRLSDKWIDKLAAAFGVPGQDIISDDAPATAEATPAAQPRSDVRIAPNAPVFNPLDLPKDVPVLGTAAGSHVGGAFQISGGAIDYVRRPPGLIGARDVYGLYVEGTSMEPQFFPGDLVYVHPHRPARVGDPIVVQTRLSHDADIEATIGIYRKQTEKHLVIQKHNPAAEVQILRNAGLSFHRIMRNNELYGV